MTYDDGSGKSSICCDSSRSPIIYHWYRSPSEAELIDCFKLLLAREPLTQADVDVFVGEFRARISLAERGRLRPIKQVKGPMKSETRFNLFEIKWDWAYGKGKSLHVRLYHVEPKDLLARGIVVGLHIHKKETGLLSWAKQTLQIRVAGKQYFVAKSNNWGLR